ncbi:hypothetical protein ACQCSU_14925 [Pseudarthrobacter sp. O4]|uniref:hypothetical protein n=1 Tax=Pseudarthrobacter sp. O4 TaxID=3418417 RepID=UPI003CF835CA
MTWPDPNVTRVVNSWGVKCTFIAKVSVTCTGSAWATTISTGQKRTVGLQVDAVKAPINPVLTARLRSGAPSKADGGPHHQQETTESEQHWAGRATAFLLFGRHRRRGDPGSLRRGGSGKGRGCGGSRSGGGRSRAPVHYWCPGCWLTGGRRG